MVIRGDDRVATVIARDASLIDVFVALSPAFERLRSASMRKVMGRLVTVEQAARVAGVDAGELLARLNAHVQGTGAPPAIGNAAASGDSEAVTAKPSADAPPSAAVCEPAALAAIPAALRRELDVRPALRAGEEPFSQIMAAVRERAPGGALAVRAIFEPVPLYAVLGRQGLEHHTERLAADDWRVWFFEDTATDAASAATAQQEQCAASMCSADASAADARVAAGSVDQDVVVLDVRFLEPPEPMMRTLAALEHLPAGATLVQVNVRVPQFLLPLLDERGFTYEVREQAQDLVRVFIRHRTAAQAVEPSSGAVHHE